MENQHKQINHIIVSIKPEQFVEPFNNDLIELNIEIKTEINEYHKREVLPRDVLKSQFDMIMESAIQEIKHYMLNT